MARIYTSHWGEPAISLHSHHVSLVQCSTCLLPVTRDLGSNPLGVLMWYRDSPVCNVCYICDPDVIDHFCGLVWGGLCPEPSLGPRADNVIIALDLTQLFCPSFMLAAGPPSSFTTDGVAAGGDPVESLQSHFILTMSHWSSGLPVCFPSQGTQVQIPWGVLVCNRVSLLAMSRYNIIITTWFFLHTSSILYFWTGRLAPTLHVGNKNNIYTAVKKFFCMA